MKISREWEKTMYFLRGKQGQIYTLNKEALSLFLSLLPPAFVSATLVLVHACRIARDIESMQKLKCHMHSSPFHVQQYNIHRVEWT